ncbi:unnamed protein product [Caenorhabditis auriculariae]|uniref:Uncharacterized protein n=1 Tax=Caenorhabditis auriculariae TaxID=2777116 RepID=A0A8S1HM97_9PELO|nr:unnamed protein product [Caenorhabditis auriculariae]
MSYYDEKLIGKECEIPKKYRLVETTNAPEPSYDQLGSRIRNLIVEDVGWVSDNASDVSELLSSGSVEPFFLFSYPVVMVAYVFLLLLAIGMTIAFYFTPDKESLRESKKQTSDSSGKVAAAMIGLCLLLVLTGNGLFIFANLTLITTSTEVSSMMYDMEKGTENHLHGYLSNIVCVLDRPFQRVMNESTPELYNTKILEKNEAEIQPILESIIRLIKYDVLVRIHPLMSRFCGAFSYEIGGAIENLKTSKKQHEIGSSEKLLRNAQTAMAQFLENVEEKKNTSYEAGKDYDPTPEVLDLFKLLFYLLSIPFVVSSLVILALGFVTLFRFAKKLRGGKIDEKSHFIDSSGHVIWICGIILFLIAGFCCYTGGIAHDKSASILEHPAVSKTVFGEITKKGVYNLTNTATLYETLLDSFSFVNFTLTRNIDWKAFISSEVASIKNIKEKMVSENPELLKDLSAYRDLIEEIENSLELYPTENNAIRNKVLMEIKAYYAEIDEKNLGRLKNLAKKLGEKEDEKVQRLLKILSPRASVMARPFIFLFFAFALCAIAAPCMAFPAFTVTRFLFNDTGKTDRASASNIKLIEGECKIPKKYRLREKQITSGTSNRGFESYMSNLIVGDVDGVSDNARDVSEKLNSGSVKSSVLFSFPVVLVAFVFFLLLAIGMVVAHFFTPTKESLRKPKKQTSDSSGKVAAAMIGLCLLLVLTGNGLFVFANLTLINTSTEVSSMMYDMEKGMENYFYVYFSNVVCVLDEPLKRVMNEIIPELYNAQIVEKNRVEFQLVLNSSTNLEMSLYAFRNFTYAFQNGYCCEDFFKEIAEPLRKIQSGENQSLTNLGEKSERNAITVMTQFLEKVEKKKTSIEARKDYDPAPEVLNSFKLLFYLLSIPFVVSSLVILALGFVTLFRFAKKLRGGKIDEKSIFIGELESVWNDLKFHGTTFRCSAACVCEASFESRRQWTCFFWICGIILFLITGFCFLTSGIAYVKSVSFLEHPAVLKSLDFDFTDFGNKSIDSRTVLREIKKKGVFNLTNTETLYETLLDAFSLGNIMPSIFIVWKESLSYDVATIKNSTEKLASRKVVPPKELYKLEKSIADLKASLRLYPTEDNAIRNKVLMEMKAYYVKIDEKILTRLTNLAKKLGEEGDEKMQSLLKILPLRATEEIARPFNFLFFASVVCAIAATCMTFPAFTVTRFLFGGTSKTTDWTSVSGTQSKAEESPNYKTSSKNSSKLPMRMLFCVF